jgi:WD40 repeat protein
MPPAEPLGIFISYARRDGTALAQRLQADLTAHGFDTWLDSQRIAGGAVWSSDIEHEIDRRPVTLALLSPASYASEICRAEQLRALDKGNRVIPLVAVNGSDRPIYLYARQFRDFTNQADYPTRLAELLSDIRGDATATLPDKYRKTPIKYLTAPPRVANYLERPEALHALRDALFAEDHRQPIALTAVHGMGGIGKTVLAKALTDDEVVQRAFPDGIVWITAGKERKRDFMAEMREVAKALGDDLSGYDNDLACENQYRTTIASKAALIVVDDVWSKADIEPLLVESPRSRFLFTTRDAAIGNLVGARDHAADLLDDAQSGELLALWANKPFSELPAVADEIISECGRLPLALSVLGGMLRGKNAQYWADTLARLREADISSIRKQLPTGQETFFKAVETSVQSLEPAMQDQYKTLAVLLEDRPAPLAILATLWNMDASNARIISNRLVELSLAQPEGVTESIRLHDLQLDYVRAQYPDKEALDLIHGAIRLSSNVIAKDPGQFASQTVARLLLYQDMPAIGRFTKQVSEGTRVRWLRPIHSALRSPGTGMVRSVELHQESVNAVAICADGQQVVSASSDKTLKVWDLETGRKIHTLIGHKDIVHAVAVTPDGQCAVSASSDATLKVWDLRTGRELSTFKGHGNSVTAAAVTPDGQHAVSGSWDETIKIWELGSGRELTTLTGHKTVVTALAITTDGRHVVSGSWDQTLKVWEIKSGREVCTFAGHMDRITAVAVVPDRRLAISASRDQTIRLWDLESARELDIFRGHSKAVAAVAVMPDGLWAISASWDRTVRLWELKTGRQRAVLTGHESLVYAVAVTPDGKRAISGSSDHTMKVWDLTDSTPLHNFAGHSDGVDALVLTRDGRRAVSASRDQTLKVWDVESGHELCSLVGHTDRVSAATITRDGKKVVSASYDHKLKVWELKTGRELCTLEGHTSWVTAVTMLAKGNKVVSGSNDMTVKVWSVKSGQELLNLEGHRDRVTAVSVTPDGQRALSAAANRKLKLWDLTNGRVIDGWASPFAILAVLPDLAHAVSVRPGGALELWDLASGRELRTLQSFGMGNGSLGDSKPAARCFFLHRQNIKVVGPINWRLVSYIHVRCRDMELYGGRNWRIDRSRRRSRPPPLPPPRRTETTTLTASASGLSSDLQSRRRQLFRATRSVGLQQGNSNRVELRSIAELLPPDDARHTKFTNRRAVVQDGWSLILVFRLGNSDHFPR